jgi:hypothetical protein
MPNQLTLEDIVRPLQRCKEMHSRVSAIYRWSVILRMKVTDMNEMPCRLNDGLHEWCNEIATVPN